MASAPGVFQFGANRAVAVNDDGSLNTSQNPAEAGSWVVVYLTGQGALDHPIDSGAAASEDPLSRPLASSAVTIGGLGAETFFLGMTPGSVGLAQANVKIPELEPGDYALVVFIGSVPSVTTWVSVK